MWEFVAIKEEEEAVFGEMLPKFNEKQKIKSNKIKYKWKTKKS